MQPTDLCCFYSDLGRPYFPLIKRMTESAKRVMPDARTILLTPTPTPELCALFDQHVHFTTMQTTVNTVCYDKATAIVSWQKTIDRLTVFIDPDLEFKRPIDFPSNADIGLLWRGTTAYPVNGGMIFTQPGCAKFWTRYGNICAGLPKPFRSWFADQLALAIMIGDYHKAGEIVEAYDRRIKLFPCYEICARPEDATENAWAIHLKGVRKGPEFEQFFSPPRKSGDGTLSVVSAS